MAQPTLKGLAPNLMVDDLPASIDFYQNTLGFERLMTHPEQEPVWAMLKRDGVEVMLQTKDNLTLELPHLQGTDIGASLTFYIEVTGIETLYGQLKDKVQVIRELETTFYSMKEFYFLDNSGYILAFAEKS